MRGNQGGPLGGDFFYPQAKVEHSTLQKQKSTPLLELPVAQRVDRRETFGKNRGSEVASEPFRLQVQTAELHDASKSTISDGIECILNQ